MALPTTLLRLGLPAAAAAVADPEHRPQAAVLGGLAGLALTSGGRSVPRAAAVAAPKPAPAAPAQKPLPTAETATTVREMIDAKARKEIPGWEAKWRDAMGTGVAKAAADFGIKLSELDMGLGIGIPNTPFSIGTRGQRKDRLDGMERWVPTDTIERAYEGLRSSEHPMELMQSEGSRGMLRDPLLGAGIAAALSRYGVPGLGGLGTGAAAVLGGLGGLAYNRFTAGDRERNMYEAIKGVTRERQSAIGQQRHESAFAPRPLLLSNGDAA